MDDYEEMLLATVRAVPPKPCRIELRALPVTGSATSGLLICDGPVPMATIIHRESMPGAFEEAERLFHEHITAPPIK